MRNSNSRLRIIVSWLADLLFIGTYVITSVAYNQFLNWYDTGDYKSDGWLSAAVGGVLFGYLALKVERRLYEKRGFWPQNRFGFFVRIIALSTLYITLSFAVGTGTVYVLGNVSNGSGFQAVLQGIALILVGAMLFSFPAIPFGTIAGIAISFLLRHTLSFHVRWIPEPNQSELA